MHKCLECLGVSLAEYVRYSPLLFFFLFSLYPRLLQSDAGVQEQEQEIPGGAYYYVEIPDDQE